MKGRIEKRKRNKEGSYAKMLRQLLVQNQQIIIQNQNMMFMVMKQWGQQAGTSSNQQRPQSQSQPQQQQMPTSQQTISSHSSQPSTSTTTSTTTIATPRPTNSASQPMNGHQQQQQQQQQQTALHQLGQPQQQHLQQHHHTLEGEMNSLHQSCQQLSNQLMAISNNNGSGVVTGMESLHTMQQVSSQQSDTMCQLQENMGHYLTPAASEQDPISDDKQEEEELAAAWDDDGLLHNNFMYNPQTDIGVVTPYKNQPNQHQTPSYYSSDCESLSTPRVEQQRPPPPPVNITQHAVKNLADSFKSPTKPKINIQFLSGPATKDMKNNKVKIIQRMNIPKFLRSVHPDGDTN